MSRHWHFNTLYKCLGTVASVRVKNITINVNNFVENYVSFSEETRTVEEKVICILNVAATSTKRIQCALEVIFTLIFIKVTRLKP